MLFERCPFEFGFSKILASLKSVLFEVNNLKTNYIVIFELLIVNSADSVDGFPKNYSRYIFCKKNWIFLFYKYIRRIFEGSVSRLHNLSRI